MLEGHEKSMIELSIFPISNGGAREYNLKKPFGLPRAFIWIKSMWIKSAPQLFFDFFSCQTVSMKFHQLPPSCMRATPTADRKISFRHGHGHGHGQRQGKCHCKRHTATATATATARPMPLGGGGERRRRRAATPTAVGDADRGEGGVNDGGGVGWSNVERRIAPLEPLPTPLACAREGRRGVSAGEHKQCTHG